MNRRTLKKKCARAARLLIEQHGYDEGAFVKADGDEAMYAPMRMERRFVETHGRPRQHGGFLKPGPLKGTILLLEKTSHEYDEWDFDLPSERLAEIEHWASIPDEQYAEWAKEGLGQPYAEDTPSAYSKATVPGDHP